MSGVGGWVAGDVVELAEACLCLGVMVQSWRSALCPVLNLAPARVGSCGASQGTLPRDGTQFTR